MPRSNVREKKNTSEKRQLVEELHAPARRDFPRRRIIVRGYDDLWQADVVDMRSYSRPKLSDLRRKQHATRRGRNNEDVSVSVRVSSALRLASDSRGEQNTVFCLPLTNESDGLRASLHAACSSISRYALNVSLTAFLIV